MSGYRLGVSRRCRESDSIRLQSHGERHPKELSLSEDRYGRRSILGLTDDLGDRDAVEKHSEQANVKMVDKLTAESKYPNGDHPPRYQVPPVDGEESTPSDLLTDLQQLRFRQRANPSQTGFPLDEQYQRRRPFDAVTLGQSGFPVDIDDPHR